MGDGGGDFASALAAFGVERVAGDAGGAEREFSGVVAARAGGRAMSGRAAMLARIRAAQGGAAVGEVVLGYRRESGLGAEERFALLGERLVDYGVCLTEVRDVAGLRAALGERLAALGYGRVAVPDDLPLDWVPQGVAACADFSLDDAALEAIPAALTGCAWAIAETGSIVMDGGAAQGRRGLTLLPDHHFCVVRAEQIVGSVPEAIARLEAAAAAGRAITFLSGPSATADIEFDRVVGVHGPRRLDVLIVAGP
jgi:L-lactate dehydrogenase complex protein LldG